MKNLFIIFATVLTVSVFAQASSIEECIEQNDSTVGMEQCQHEEYLRLKNVLRNEYIRLLDSKGKNAQKFVNSHLSWALKAESACTGEVADREGGSSQGFAKAACLSRMTEQRINQVVEMQ